MEFVSFLAIQFQHSPGCVKETDEKPQCNHCQRFELETVRARSRRLTIHHDVRFGEQRLHLIFPPSAAVYVSVYIEFSNAQTLTELKHLWGCTTTHSKVNIALMSGIMKACKHL